jgi:hypothetical protein
MIVARNAQERPAFVKRVHRGTAAKAGVSSFLGAHAWIAGALLIGGGLVHQHFAKQETRLARSIPTPAGAVAPVAPFAVISNALGEAGKQ